MKEAQKSTYFQSVAKILADIAKLEAEREHIALTAFSVLEQHDPETARLALHVFDDDRGDAAIWFTRILVFSGCTPWHLLAAGEAPKVRAILNTITDGRYFFDW